MPEPKPVEVFISHFVEEKSIDPELQEHLWRAGRRGPQSARAGLAEELRGEYPHCTALRLIFRNIGTYQMRWRRAITPRNGPVVA